MKLATFNLGTEPFGLADSVPMFSYDDKLEDRRLERVERRKRGWDGFRDQIASMAWDHHWQDWDVD